MKKLFIISTSIFFLSVIVFIVYNVFFNESAVFVDRFTKKSGEKTENSQNNEAKKNEKKQEEKNNNKIENGKIQKISEQKVRFPKIDRIENKIKYYTNDKNSGFWKMSFDGSFKKKIVDENFDNLSAIIWSADAKRIILKINGEYYRYDYGKKPEKIKNNVSYLNWSNLNKKIFYIYNDTSSGKREIDMADFDGKNWKKIFELKDDNRYVIKIIPHSSLIAVYTSPDGSKQTNLDFIGIVSGNIDKSMEGGFGEDYLWSPNGEKFLSVAIVDKGGNDLILRLNNMNDNETVNLNFPTMISKCVWSKDNIDIYCALPSEIPNNTVLPNDYDENRFYTTDSFWKINTETGEKERIVNMEDIDEKIDAFDLMLSPNEDILFFVNKRNGNLYRITL